MKTTCCVNVGDFGAVGEVLSTKGSIQAASKVLTVDNLRGWVVGAGVGIADAAAGLTPPAKAALVTRVVSIDPVKKALNLKDAAANTVANVVVTVDDSLPIQDSIDSLGKDGGTVCLPPGTYVIGTTGATTNQPIVLGSNVRVLGAGVGATIVQLCQEANILYRADAATPVTGLRMAGPIFLNTGNFWWFDRTAKTDGQQPFYGLPHDSNIEIAGITFDGDKNHQTLVYEPDYRPNSTPMPAPTDSVFLAGAWDAAGKLPAGPAVYHAFVRFQDASGNEGVGAYGFEPVNLGLKDASGAPNNALLVSLPPVFPTGAVAVVPYVRRADPSTSANPINELDASTNPRSERLDPILLSSVKPWDGNPDSSHWPTILIRTHTLFPQGAVDTQGNYRFPGIVNFSGNTGASYFGYFINVERLYLHDIEVRNFVEDGIGLDCLIFSKFDRVHSHNNGRHGVSIVTSALLEEVDLNDCVFASNSSSGVDMEPIACKSLRWNRCCFLNNGFGAALDPSPLGCHDVEFNNCLFDGNTWHLQITGPGTANIANLKIKDCRFRNNDSNCVVIGSAGISAEITGEITGCEFDQANGRTRDFGSRFDLFCVDVPAILLGGAKTVFRLTNNHFKPWAAVQTGPDGVARSFFSSAFMIDISGTGGGQTIQNNHFESNPLDTRPAISPGPGVEWSTNIKNQHFLSTYLDSPGPLISNEISGNIGDGLIWTGTRISGSTLPCGLDLQEEAILTTLTTGTTSSAVTFVHALPGSYSPASGDYLVAAAFNWNVGAWWISDATPSGLTINWQNPTPGSPVTPQLIWSAKFVG